MLLETPLLSLRRLWLARWLRLEGRLWLAGRMALEQLGRRLVVVHGG